MQKAVKALKKAVELKDQWVEARLSLALFYEVLEEKGLAIHEYEEILKMAPLSVPIYRRIASLYHGQGNYEKAREVYQLLKDVYPQDLSNYLALGYLALKNQKPGDAIRALQEAKIKNLESVELYFLLGLAYEMGREFETAILTYRKGLELFGENDQFSFHIGACYAELGKIELAEAPFQDAIRLNPNHADAMNYLGYLWADRGIRLDEAIDWIRKALKLDPGNAAYMDSLGWAYYKKGLYPQAVKILEEAVEVAPEDALLRSHLGEAYFGNGQWEEALREWEESLRLNPDNELLKKKVEGIKDNLRIKD
jgi:tetratricopeptide (TPR) repeat protein